MDQMRRRAVLVVEYAKESGRPLTVADWERLLAHGLDMQKVSVEVQEDEPA